MIAETLMIGVMIYQVTMPDIKNGKFRLIYDGVSIIRMNTQDGTMERCDKNLKCEPLDKTKEK